MRITLLAAVALWYGCAAAQCVASVRFGSIALAANSVGHIAVASTYVLSLFPQMRRSLPNVIASLFLFPALIIVAELWHRLHTPVAPPETAMGATAMGTFLVDLAAATAIARLRPGGMAIRSSLKALLWPRTVTVPLILVAALATAATGSGWHDLIVGFGVLAGHYGSIQSVWTADRT